MALVGDLRNINLGDIFQTLGMNRQVGTLVVRDGIREHRVFFSMEGVSVCSTRSTREARIGTFLVREQIISNDDLLSALARQKEQGGLIGDHIVAMGLCDQQVIDDAIRYQAASQLYHLFFWQEGEFEFIERPTPTPADAASPYIGCKFDPSGVVLEAARRVDEWRLVDKSIPEKSEFFVASEDATQGDEGGDLTPRHKAVLALADGTRDVEAILQESHLARFDTGTYLHELLQSGFIRTATTEELLSQAWKFFDRKDPERAIRCLTRATLQDPSSPRVLELLVHCHEALEERRLAAASLYKLGNIRFLAGDAGEAVTALEKSAKYDPRSAETRTLLMRLYIDLGDTSAAAGRGAEACEILAADHQWESCIQVAREALKEAPEDVPLRIHLVNALQAMGLPDKALGELVQVAGVLERTREPQELEQIYKKILTLDPSRTEYLRRLQRLQTKAARRRQNLVRVAAVASLAVVVLVLAIVVVTGSSNAQATLGNAWALFRNGRLDRAEALAREVITASPESDEAIDARNLLAAIQSERRGGAGQTRNARLLLEDAIDRRYVPAENWFLDLRFSQGIDQLMQLVVFYNGAECKDAFRRLSAQVANRIRNDTRSSVRTLLNHYAKHLEKLQSIARSELTQLKDRSLLRSDLEILRDTRDETLRIRDQAAAGNRHKNLITAEAVETALFDTRESTERLKAVCSRLDAIRDDANGFYHRTRAQLLKREIFLDFSSALKQINDLKNRGGLQQARNVCQEFLARCYELDRQSPAQIYRPVAKELFDNAGPNLDGRIQTEMQGVDQVIEAIAEGNELIASGHYADANAHLRELLRANFRIDFSGHVRLVMQLKTRPHGAQVSSRLHTRAPLDHGRTTPDAGVLVRYHPYGTTRVTVFKESFAPVEILINGFADDHDATLLIDLNKQVAWQATAGPAQGTPTVWGDAVLVASRDGHLRAYDKRDGSARFDHDAEVLSGFSQRPLVTGDEAILTSPARELFAVDLKSVGSRWTFKADALLATAPRRCSDLVVVADEDGRLYAVREGAEVWRQQLSGKIRGTPVTTADAVFVAATDGGVARLDGRTGSVVWERSAGAPVYSSPELVAGDIVLVCTEASRILAFTAKDGREIWHHDLPDAIAGRPVSFGDIVYALTMPGSVTMLMASTGEVLDRQDLDVKGPFPHALAVNKGAVYAVSATGVVLAFSPANGRIWSVETGEAPAGEAMISDGYLYVLGEKGKVTAFSLAGD